jgi:hypothetical protein
MWSQRWGLERPGGDSQGSHGVKPTSVTTESPGGILFEISPLENSHDLLWHMRDTTRLVSLHEYLRTGIQEGEVQKKTFISLNSKKSSRIDA